jgi:hypothetical protein
VAGGRHLTGGQMRCDGEVAHHEDTMATTERAVVLAFCGMAFLSGVQEARGNVYPICFGFECLASELHCQTSHFTVRRGSVQVNDLRTSGRDVKRFSTGGNWFRHGAAQ